VKSTHRKAPETTRRTILDAAFAEIYKNGFQGASLNRIVEVAGATKGALFYHFAGKQELGYAVVEEILGPLVEQSWLDAIEDSDDVIADLKRAFRHFVKASIRSKTFLQGCPLNNLAQEMSPLDEGFRKRINRLYGMWRKRYAAALAAGMKTGRVKKDIVPQQVAALVVAAQMGIWGTGKSSRDPQLMTQAAEAVCGYLESLRSG
jgi:TetR/AcrR family transcriptional regulator, transcriptional repressor for nem operon